MHRRHHAQRQHIILSLDALLYQLHTLSFILSPSIWAFLFRLVCQFQCSKPRDLDATASRSLRFFFANIIFFNASSLWFHATQGAAEGRAIVLDFVGLAYVPSKLQLLGLDILIIFLQMVLTTIAYETSLLEHSTEPDTHDMLLPIPNPPSLPPTPLPISISSPSTPFSHIMPSHTKPYPSSTTLPYVLDLRFAPIMARLRNPPPPPRTSGSDNTLPLPNTTPWPLPAGMRMLMRAGVRTRMGREGSRDTATPATGSTIPGGLTS
ncbi:hypothetical protein Hypma_007858 [Hypsizygus marmoreus]|uniref:DUF1746 domain-containing protein n=1 Tax=Hypsizygus marmoreus TaxID=39966 RepID=A0A369JZD7_HYPMA|nr:hypothetical protein Hypma_007858 [Hypsizygus marmoreus]